MDIGSILLILSLSLFVIMFVARPFFESSPQAAAVSQADHDLSALLAERERVLNSLHELDFDFTLGKVPEEDYPMQRAALIEKGADVLRRLDSLAALSPSTPKDAGKTADSIEIALAARRSARELAAVKVNGEDDEIEALIAARRRTRQEKSAGFCPKCGKPVLKSDKFCPKCGNSLA